MSKQLRKVVVSKGNVGRKRAYLLGTSGKATAFARVNVLAKELHGKVILYQASEARRLRLVPNNRTTITIESDSGDKAIVDSEFSWEQLMTMLAGRVLRQGDEHSLAPEPNVAVPAQERLLNVVFAASEWYDSATLSRMCNFSEKNASAQPYKWKKAGKLFALRRGNKDVYPAYAFDDHCRPLRAMKDVLDIFHDKKSDLKTAFWFASVNSWLRDKRPLDVIGTNPEAVIKAAKFEVAPIDHG